MVQAQPKHLANIRRENDLRASAGLALCGKRGALAGDAAVTRGQQEGVNFTTSCLQGDAGDLPARIYGACCLEQKQGGVGGNQGVEVGHHAVLPEKGSAVFRLIAGPPNYLALAVNPVAAARKVTWKCPEVPHHAVFPEESVNGCVARQVGETGHLALVINVVREVYTASETAEVSHRAVLPQQCVKRRCATTRDPGNLVAVVDRRSKSIRVAGECREFLDLALFPDNRLKLENLRGLAGWIRCTILRLPDHLATAVNPGGKTVTASQCRERGRHAFLPNGRQTYQVRTETNKNLPPKGLECWSPPSRRPHPVR
jgi:hypothetical protein